MKNFIFIFLLSLTIGFSNVYSQDIEFQLHEQSHGWLNWVNGSTTLAGKKGDKRIEAIRIKLVGFPPGASIYYRAHVQGIGWQNWVSNGQIAGTTGQSLRLEALEVKLQNAPSNLSVCYQLEVGERANRSGMTLIDFYPGGLSYACDGNMAGTEGRRRPVWRIGIELRDKNSLENMPTEETTDQSLYIVAKNGTSLNVKFNKTSLIRIHRGRTYIPYWEGWAYKGNIMEIKKRQWCEIRINGKWAFMTDANNL